MTKTKTKTTITTPLGSFKSVVAAAAAHKVDRATLLKRLATIPEEYQKKVQKIMVQEPAYTVRGARWPISWAQYRSQDYDTREEIYQAWCSQRQLDPEAESTVNTFFEQMDVFSTQELEDESQQELDV